MNKKYNTQNWVGNMYQRFEAVCHEVDEFVHKDTVKYVENHMQTVGENVKKFYSGVFQDILPPLVEPAHHVAQLIPSKRIDLVETYTRSLVGMKENTVGSNTNKPENTTFVPTEKLHEPSSTDRCHSDQISCAVSGYPIGETDANSFFQQEGDNKINKTSDKSSQEDFVVDQSPCTDISSSKHHKDSSEAIIRIRCIDEKSDDDHSAKISRQSLLENHLDNKSFEEAGILCNTSSKIDISSSKHHKDSSEAIIRIRCIDEKCDDDDDDDSAKISRQSSENHLDNKSFEESGILSNTSSKIDASVFEDADWGIENIFDLNMGIGEKIDGEPSEDVNNSADRILFPFVEEKSEKVPIDEFESDSNTSSELKSSITWDENKEEKALCIFSGGLLPAKSYDSSSEHDHSNLAPFEASVSCSKIGIADGSMVDIEDLNMHSVDLSDKKQVAGSCGIPEDKTLFSFPYGSRRSKSYKKIIQDAFMSRKKLTKEYKQLAIWYGDIEKEFSKPTEEIATPKSPARDLCDSEWEIL